jgi:hypothetical protein
MQQSGCGSIGQHPAGVVVCPPDPPLDTDPLEDPPLETVPLDDPPLDTAPLEDPPVETEPLEDPPFEGTPLEEPPLEEVSGGVTGSTCPPLSEGSD